jgi:nicotinate phosphoribosyltransferase
LGLQERYPPGVSSGAPLLSPETTPGGAPSDKPGFSPPRWEPRRVRNLALLTDLYQLTMLAGYHACGKTEQHSCFELFFRRLPFQGGFAVAAGLETVLDYLNELRFDPEQIDYLRSLGLFRDDFLKWLETFRFRGDVDAVPEGELVFAHEPLLQVRGTLPEAQLIESALLNILNFQTLIATKSARITVASRGAPVLEFGMRRAQGVDGAVSASRAAFIGGCQASSNTLAGQTFNIPVKGTHAHSWVMSFSSELEAFRAYADLYPDDCTLLVDTYDTLESGVPNAIRVGHELRQRGHELKGIRLDSGDLAYLSKRSRAMLDEAGLTSAKIVASNDLDENLIADLLEQGARIDIWGVGTNLVTSQDQPALGGVYKLVAAEPAEGGPMEPRMKISSNPEKSTLPGVKRLLRAYDAEGTLTGDCLCLESESVPAGPLLTMHPHYAGSQQKISAARWQSMLVPVMRQGQEVPGVRRPLTEIRASFLENLKRLPVEHQRRVNPQTYWVGLSPELFGLRDQLLARARS